VILSLIRAHRAARQSPLPEKFRTEIAASFLRFRRLPERGTVRLFDRDIRYLGLNSLRVLFDEIFVRGCYLFETNKSAPVIVDCGSNIGMSVLFFKLLYPLANVTAFEPDPATFEALRTNTSDMSDVVLHQAALGATDGVINFYRDSDPDTSSLLMSANPLRKTGACITVPVRRLSSFLPPHVDLLKIDVEGSEGAVLSDLVGTGAIQNAEQIHLEYHHHIEDADDNLSETLAMLERAGFGYQIRSDGSQKAGAFQDISIYCYKRS
jgi:FkbM family methyltransferase